MQRAYVIYSVIKATLITIAFLAAVGVAGWIETGGN
jgi:hypothetical protein